MNQSHQSKRYYYNSRGKWELELHFQLFQPLLIQLNPYYKLLQSRLSQFTILTINR